MKNCTIFSQMWRIGTKFSQMWRIGTRSSRMWRIGIKSSHLWKIDIKSLHVKNSIKTHTIEELIPNSHMKNLYQITTDVKNWYFIVTDVSDNLSMWRLRMCAIWNVRIFHKVWDIWMKYVTYWYQFFICIGELVPILHSGIFMMCEICGWTTCFVVT